MIGLIALGAAPSAFAKPSLLAIDDAAPTLTEKDDGTRAGKLRLTNLTDGALTLSAAPSKTSDKACKPKLSRAAIGAAQSVETKLNLPTECRLAKDEFELTLTVTGKETQQVPVVAKAEEGAEDPDWSQLLIFFIALPVIAVALYAAFVARASYGFTEPLTYLDAAYSFKDSWVSNVTVIAGLLTGIFGSASVVKAFLGQDAEQSIALATVGSALALILIGFGPIMLNAAKVITRKGDEDVRVFSVGGLLLATTVTVAGAFGQLWIGWRSGAALDLGGLEHGIIVGFLAAVLLLIWSTYTTVTATISDGRRAPPPAKPTELAQLIELFKNAMKRNNAVPTDEIPSVVDDVLASAGREALTSVGDERPEGQRRRAAMP
jgi:hypothetical protein